MKDIYDFFKEKSLQGAKNVRADIVRSPKSIKFAKQYQIDDVNPLYRRIIVRDYKVLYTEDIKGINVIDIVSTKQSPKFLEGK